MKQIFALQKNEETYPSTRDMICGKIIGSKSAGWDSKGIVPWSVLVGG